MVNGSVCLFELWVLIENRHYFTKIWQNNFVPLVQHKNNTALNKFSL